MAVFQTAGVPPSSGRTILANIGCTEKDQESGEEQGYGKQPKQ